MVKRHQSHLELAKRLDRIAWNLRQLENPTDEQVATIHDFEQQAIEHRIKASIAGDQFTMMLPQ